MDHPSDRGGDDGPGARCVCCRLRDGGICVKKSLLVVDDDPTICNAVKDYFEAKQFDVATVSTLAEAQIAFRSRRPDVAVVDYMLPDGDALQLLERFKAVDPNCPVIVLTGHAS